MNDSQIIDSIINKYSAKGQALIPILQEIQSNLNWLPPEVLSAVAKKLDIPLIDIYSVVTFYRSFRLKPRGKHLITICLGTACHVRGAPRVLDNIQRKLNMKIDETTKDNLFTLETVNCLGACALGPVVVVDNEYHGQMTKTKVDLLIKDLKRPKKSKEK